MKRSSTMRRRYASAMLTGMLTAALLSSSCASRRCNLTAVRSDSLSASVTERTVYEPVPKRTAGLKVSAAQWTQLRNLPEGFGLAVRTDGMNLSLTADGEGGVSVTAEADSIGREVTYRREETANRTRGETREEETEKREPSRWWCVLPALLIAVVATVLIKRN